MRSFGLPNYPRAEIYQAHALHTKPMQTKITANSYKTLLNSARAPMIGVKSFSKHVHSRSIDSTPPNLQRIADFKDSPSYSLRKSRKRKRYTDEWVSGDYLAEAGDSNEAPRSLSPSPSPVHFDRYVVDLVIPEIDLPQVFLPWEPPEQQSSDSDFEVKKKRIRRPRPRTPKPKVRTIPESPKIPSLPPRKRRRKLAPPTVRPTFADEESDPEYLPSTDTTAYPHYPNVRKKGGVPYKRRSRRGQVLGHVEDCRNQKKKLKKKPPKKNKFDNVKPIIPDVKAPDPAIRRRPVLNYDGNGRSRRNVERKNYAEPMYFWEPPPVPSHIEKPKPSPEKKKKNLVANPPDEKLFELIHLRDDSTRVRLHQSKLFYRLEHSELPLTMIFANHDGHSEQLRAKNDGWKLLREQRSFHIPKTEGFAKKFIGVLKFKGTVVASVLFYPGCHDTKVTIRYFVTLEEYRSTGFGKILAVGIRQYIDHVFPSVHEIELWALNEAARAFWQSVGYNIVGKQKQKMRCQHHTRETYAYVQWAVHNCRKKMVDKKYMEAPPPKKEEKKVEEKPTEIKQQKIKEVKPIIPKPKSPKILPPPTVLKVPVVNLPPKIDFAPPIPSLSNRFPQRPYSTSMKQPSILNKASLPQFLEQRRPRQPLIEEKPRQQQRRSQQPPPRLVPPPIKNFSYGSFSATEDIMRKRLLSLGHNHMPPPLQNPF